MPRLTGLKFIAVLYLVGVFSLIYYTLAALFASGHGNNELYFESSKNGYQRRSLLSEFQTLAKSVNETVDTFGVRFLARQATVAEAFCRTGRQSEIVSCPLQKSCFASCHSSQKRVLLIFPIRDRWELLHQLLQKLLPLLGKQQGCVFIFVVEQTRGLSFNKGLLMNAAVILASESVPFDCIIFHDVDLVPEVGRPDSSLHYDCPDYPRHMSAFLDKFDYKLPYLGLIGGILAVPVDHFLRVNGFSNMFWGWGGEDDDLYERFSYIGLPITRPIQNPKTYKMIPHESSAPSDLWRKNSLLQTSLKRYRLDGLNSVNYKLVVKKTIFARELFQLNHVQHFSDETNVLYILVDPVDTRQQ